METIITGNTIIFAIVCGIANYKGLDLKEYSSWWCGLYGFISGFLIGISGGEATGTNWLGGFGVGIVFACIVLVGGAVTFRNRIFAENSGSFAEQELKEQLDNLAETLFNDRSKK